MRKFGNCWSCENFKKKFVIFGLLATLPLHISSAMYMLMKMISIRVSSGRQMLGIRVNPNGRVGVRVIVRMR